MTSFGRTNGRNFFTWTENKKQLLTPLTCDTKWNGMKLIRGKKNCCDKQSASARVSRCIWNGITVSHCIIDSVSFCANWNGCDRMCMRMHIARRGLCRARAKYDWKKCLFYWWIRYRHTAREIQCAPHRSQFGVHFLCKTCIFVWMKIAFWKSLFFFRSRPINWPRSGDAVFGYGKKLNTSEWLILAQFSMFIYHGNGIQNCSRNSSGHITAERATSGRHWKKSIREQIFEIKCLFLVFNFHSLRLSFSLLYLALSLFLALGVCLSKRIFTAFFTRM